MFTFFNPVLSYAADLHVRNNFTYGIQYFKMFLQTVLYILFRIKKIIKKTANGTCSAHVNI